MDSANNPGAIAGVAGATAAAMYIDAKTGIVDDASTLLALKRNQRQWARTVQQKRTSLYYLWEDAVKQRGDSECIWSRDGCYTWTQAHARVHQYAQWFLGQGVKPNDLVAFYLQNSPDFMLAWFGLWAVGAAPAMINHNLAGKALAHCLKISGAKLMLADADPVLRGRIVGVQAEIDAVGMRWVALDRDLKTAIYNLPPSRPGDEYRAAVKGNDPICLYYTR